MHELFLSCLEIKELNLNNFKTSKVNNMNLMFYHCASLKSLNLSNFYTSQDIYE